MTIPSQLHSKRTIGIGILVALVVGGIGVAEVVDRTPAPLTRSTEANFIQGGPDGAQGRAVSASGGGCFTEDALIATPRGQVPITSLQEGDTVYSFSDSGEVIETRVTDLVIHDGVQSYRQDYEEYPLLRVTFADGGKTTVTANHAYYSLDAGEWKDIGEFDVGEKVIRVHFDGGQVAQRSVTEVASMTELDDEPVVYNVHTDHESNNYFANGVLVHNGDDEPPLLLKAARMLIATAQGCHAPKHDCYYNYQSPYKYQYQYQSPYNYQYQYQSPYNYQYQYQYEYQTPAPPVSNVQIDTSIQQVRSGDTTEITWSSQDAVSCTVTEDNPNVNDSWTGTSGTETTSELESETIYTVTCQGGDGSEDSADVTVEIVPEFQEI